VAQKGIGFRLSLITPRYIIFLQKIVKMSSNSTKKYSFVIFQRKHKSVHLEFSRQIDEGFD